MMRGSGGPASHGSLSGFEGQDFRTLLDGVAKRRASHPFLIWEPFEGESTQWTYAAFAAAVRRLAAGLQGRGVHPGERVLIHCDNRPEFLLAWLGCAYAGAVAVTTNTKSAVDEIAYYASHSAVVGAVTEEQYAAAVRSALPPGAWMVAAGAAGPETAFETLDGEPEALLARPHDPSAPFSIQYTSGTTARPKAVLWSHANALWGAQMSAMHEALGPADVHLVHLPLFHTNAQAYSVLSTLWAGGTVVLQPRFSASRFWAVSQRHGCTWTSMVPFCVRALLAQPVPVRHGYRLFGNAVCEHPADAALGVRTLGWWGMTETVTHGIVGSAFGADAPLSMGRPSPGYEILILDERRQPVAPGEVGDLHVRGRRGVNLFVEYLNDPAATAAAFTDDGLFITGDRVLRSADGYIYFVERARDMLKVGGENVAASEIERVVMTVPGVSEVAVAGRPHAMLDEVPVAFVIAAPPGSEGLVDAIERACAAGLAVFKRPAEIRLVDELPRSTLNKVSKSALKMQLARETDAQDPSSLSTNTERA